MVTRSHDVVDFNATFVSKDDFGIKVVIHDKVYSIPQAEEFNRQWEYYSQEDHGREISVRMNRSAANALRIPLFRS